jgi:hypothetical protein
MDNKYNQGTCPNKVRPWPNDEDVAWMLLLLFLCVCLVIKWIFQLLKRILGFVVNVVDDSDDSDLKEDQPLCSFEDEYNYLD